MFCCPLICITIIYWDWLSANESGIASTRNLFLIVLAVFALYLAIWRSRIAEQQADAAQEQSVTAQQGLLNERYQKGAEMLGSDVLSVRFGGIHALQGLASEYPKQYHIQIMHLFCAFVRNPPRHKESEDRGKANDQRSTLREDVQAVMTVIGDRSEKSIGLEKKEDFKLDFSSANLDWLFLKEANLSDANFRKAILSNMTLHNVALSDANLWEANLSSAKLYSVDLSDARLWEANLSSALLMTDETLRGADLSGAMPFNTNLSRADLYEANLSDSMLSGVILSKASLRKTTLSGANLSSDEPEFEPAQGLLQDQLNEARADPDNPPKLTGMLDAYTGKPLVWHGQPL